ncbi:hypothetical protein ILUMI_01922 [Ignelater luminosus]|uniref:Peroxisomal ATPase PEX6 n=1 Tax=Ignelater luminosus TaxID=2038154 RepID=A0A8K0GJS2_IGNLU|nr:hypothetical protein ILUMI_01922 [Ignelater luminosus]
MEKQDLTKSVKVLIYVSFLRFPKYSPYFFPFCMLIIYNRIRKNQKLFNIVSVPSELIRKVIEDYHLTFCDDENNTILINKNYSNGYFVKIIYRSCVKRIVYAVETSNHKVNNESAIVMSDTLKHNLGNIEDVKLSFVQPNEIYFATEIDLSLVNTNYDISNAVIDAVIKNYFKTPKFVCRNDLIVINFQKYAPEFFYTSTKYRNVKYVYFKCNKIISKHSKVNTFLCMIGETTVKQSANVQSYIAPTVKDMCSFKEEDFYNLISKCRDGLEDYKEEIERAVKPFLRKHKLDLKPTFLLQGNKGAGKSLIVSSLASKLGLHLYETASGDITSSTYAQTETKLRNIFFKTRLCTPCILTIKNFENFGKNNEGEYDERIMSFFRTELDSLFQNNSFPLILICVSNSKEIPSELTRAFLEIFTIKSPDDNQRVQMLNWILKSRNLENCANLTEIAQKTHGFLFEDFKALIYHAQKDSSDNCLLNKDNFDHALDIMQLNYNQSIGAPKIPQVQWSDVGGLNDVKQEIIRTINLPLRHPEILKTTGLKRSGILLYGPPGTGKTLIAKAVATECNLCFLSVKGPELLNMYVGQSEQNVREVFEKAREASPCIIFFDELDSLAPNRGVSGDSGGVMDRVVSQLLAEMDGLNQTATIFIIGATNRPDLIDPALLRPGRFDKLLYVGPCTDAESKLSVLKALTRKFKLDEDMNLKEIIKMCPKNITGADFYGLCSNAWMSSVRQLIENNENEKLQNLTQEDVIVTMDDFKVSLKSLKPSIRNEDLVYFENLQRQFSTNENKIKTKNLNK